MVRSHPTITQGAAQRGVYLAGMRLVEAGYEPGRVLPAHSHPSANVTLVFEGDFLERVERGRSTEEVHACPASFVLKPGGAVHSNRYGERPGRSFVIELEPARASEFGLARGPARWFHGGRSVGRLLDIYRAFLDGARDLEDVVRTRLVDVVRASDPGATGAARGPVRSRADEGGRRAPSTTRLRAERVLAERMAEAPSAAEVARDVGVHPVYLARLFRTAHGCGTAAYRRKLQVRTAARLLVETRASAASIACSVGFADQAHLCRAFKGELGWTPGAYRRLLRA